LTLGSPPPLIDLHHQPTTGLLIISPAFVTGQYLPPGEDFSALRRFRPTDVIGHSMLVYDLDVLGNGKPFDWFATMPSLRVPEGP
jgi:hypothetical protein